jgi:hypothetical protein
VKGSEGKWSDVRWSGVKWSEVSEMKWLKWSEVSYGKFIVDKVAMYIKMTLYCGHLIILWLFHLGISCNAFVLICTVVVFCNVCVCVCVGGGAGCNVCVFWWYAYCTLTEVFLNLTEVFLTLTEVFPCFFLSCKANARVKLAKTGHVPHSSKLVVIFVVRFLFVLFYVLFFVCKYVLPPRDNPIAVNKYINNKKLVRAARLDSGVRDGGDNTWLIII